MNRGKKPLTQKTQKKIKKEVHSAQKEYPAKKTKQYSDELTAKEMLKKFPKKPLKKLEAGVKAASKKVTAMKAAPKKKTSKRTGPGKVTEATNPAYPNQEGARWSQTLKKQTKANRTVQTRHTLKEKNKRPTRGKKA